MPVELDFVCYFWCHLEPPMLAKKDVFEAISNLFENKNDDR